jgi:hypothetical protein
MRLYEYVLSRSTLIPCVMISIKAMREETPSNRVRKKNNIPPGRRRCGDAMFHE